MGVAITEFLPSVLWCRWLGSRKSIRPVKNWVVGCWCDCLEWGADLHMSQLMPLPLTVSCFSKIQSGFTFLVPAQLGVPEKGPLNGCVSLCVTDSAIITVLEKRLLNGCSSSSSSSNYRVGGDWPVRAWWHVDIRRTMWFLSAELAEQQTVQPTAAQHCQHAGTHTDTTTGKGYSKSQCNIATPPWELTCHIG